MIFIIQCAASKHPQAGLFRTRNGSPVLFVADPSKAPPDSSIVYVRPDDPSDQGTSWRDLLVRYNANPAKNPFGLRQAYDLYENDAYRRLVEKFGIEKTYILSAGWGLIRADFLTPAYDITFSASADRYKRRTRKDAYQDFCMLPDGCAEPMVFFGGKDYVPLFAELTKTINAPKTVFYNSESAPEAPRCFLQRFQTSTRTNWHYECANAFLQGTIGAGGNGIPVVQEPATSLPPVRQKSSYCRGNAPISDDFRQALTGILNEAIGRKSLHIDVKSGDLHRLVGGYPGNAHRMPVCCEVMRQMMKIGDSVLSDPPSGKGASLVIRYRLSHER